MEIVSTVSSNMFRNSLPVGTDWADAFLDQTTIVSGHTGNILDVFFEEMFNSDMMVEILGEHC